MLARLHLVRQFELSIISCGDAGMELGASIITLLKSLGKEMHKSLGINSGRIDPDLDKVFKKYVSIDPDTGGFAHDLTSATAIAGSSYETLNKSIGGILPSKNGILMITVGGGGTGIASAMVVLKILREIYQQTPPVFLLLPEVFENSRVHYNVSQFLYHTVYSNNPIGNPVIVIDNKATEGEYKEPFDVVAKRRMEIIPKAIANLLYSAFTKPRYEEYNAEFRDFSEVIHTSGIGVLVAKDLENDQGELNLRFDDILFDSITEITSLPREKIAEARKVFISILNVDMQQFQFTVEAKKIKALFKDTSPYLIFADSEEEESKRPTLNAIVTGLPLPPRVIQIMKIARESRKDMIFKEMEGLEVVSNLDTERVATLEEEIENSYLKYS